MAHMLWTAALRLFAFVVISAACVAIPFAAGARMGPLPVASALLTLVLVTASVAPMLRARHLLRLLDAPVSPPPVSMVYRASAARTVEDETTADGASRAAAIAIMLLSLAVASTFVAAASR
jgi:hypothetical protein